MIIFNSVSGSFNVQNYVKKPQVILRLLSWLFSVIVIGCISAARAAYGGCPLALDINACGYGTGIGVIAMLGSMAFLFLDAFVDRMTDFRTRRNIAIADLAFTSLWTFLWFVGFCYMTNRWTMRPGNLNGFIISNINSSLAFTFFSVLSWGALIFFGVRQYQNAKNVNEQPTNNFDYPGNVGQQTPQPPPDASQKYQEPFNPQLAQDSEQDIKRSEEPPPYVPPNY